MKTYLSLLALSATAMASPPRAHELSKNYSYEQYLKDFGKGAGSKEGRHLFETHLAEILAHNQGQSSYKLGVNQFTDQAAPPKGRMPSPSAPKSFGPPDPRVLEQLNHMTDIPDSVDWRDAGVVGPVKNQGHCGSCWAFATTEVTESAVALATGLLYSLSPQQLVACAANDGHCGGDGGCMGSVPQLAYQYLIDAGGYAEEWSFPYISYQGTTNGTCNDLNVNNPIKAGITGFTTLDANNATQVMAALATVGPLAINVDASIWHNYESGVWDGCSYDAMDIDHVVNLVGYGTDETLGDYWLVRNSWSPSWGEQGYIRLKRDPVDNTPCGVDNTPLDGTGCAGGPDVQYPCGQCGVVFDVSYPTGAFSA